MYTDGVTEAFDVSGEQFSEERLKEEVLARQKDSIQDLVMGIMEEVKAFSRGLQQSDDITIITLRYFSNSKE